MSIEQTGERATEPLLVLQKVTKNFGGLAAVQDVDLQIWPGEIISIIGPNGAGKTTVFNLITGIYRVSSGDVRLAGRSLIGLSPDKVLVRGIARTFQLVRPFPALSVEDLERCLRLDNRATAEYVWQMIRVWLEEEAPPR